MRTLIAACVGVLFLAAAVPAAGQGLQTGEVTGLVRSADGLVLPGATVTARGPSLQGVRTVVTDENGKYVVRALPPGDFELVFEMTGLATRTERVAIEVARQAVVDVSLSVAGVAENVTVVGESEPSSLAASTVGATYTSREINTLPTGRTPSLIAELAPGLTANTPNTGQVTISGGFAYDSIFLINGVDVNDNLFGSANNLFIEDAIDQTSVLTSGISAEYGRFSGGIINMVTKSGGNTFTGSFRANFSNDAWTKETPREVTAKINRTDKLNQNYEWTFGGPVVRDRAWFFTAGRLQESNQQSSLQVTNQPFTTVTDSKRFEVKGTGTVAPGHSVVGNYIRNSVTQDRLPFPFTIDPNIPETFAPKNDLLVGSYNGALNDRTFLNVQASRKYNSLDGSGGTDKNIFSSPFLTLGGPGVPPQLHYNGNYFDATDPEERNNQQFSGSLAYFLSTGSFGSHDIKTGVELYTTTRTGGNSQSPTNYVFLTNYAIDASGAPIFDASGRLIPVFTPGLSQVQQWSATRGAEIDVTTTSWFVQDNWSIRDFTLSVGTRVEHVNSAADGRDDDIASTVFSPRMAATWNVKGSGTIIQTTFARYAGKLNELQSGRNTVVGQPSRLTTSYTGPAGQGRDFAAGFDSANYPNYVSSNFPTANVYLEDGMEPPKSTEFTASIGRDLWTRGTVKATYAKRSYSGVIEDFYDNPTLDGQTFIEAGGRILRVDNVYWRNSDLPTRDYQALLFQANYRPASRLMVEGHYTLQLRNNGNFEGEAANQPGIGSSVGDYPEILVPERNFPEGRLNDFQRHKVRLWALWNVPMGRFGSVDVAPIMRFDSGLTYSLAANSVPLSQIQRSRNPGYAGLPSGGLQTLFFGERGSGTFPGAVLGDLGLTYTVPVLGRLRPWIKAEFLNFTNNQKLVGYNVTVSPDPNSPLDQHGLPTGYIKGPQFGQATSNAHYPLWRPGLSGGRTYLLSAGVRF